MRIVVNQDECLVSKSDRVGRDRERGWSGDIEEERGGKRTDRGMVDRMGDQSHPGTSPPVPLDL